MTTFNAHLSAMLFPDWLDEMVVELPLLRGKYGTTGSSMT